MDGQRSDRASRSAQLRFEGRSSSMARLIPVGADPSNAPPVTLRFPPGLELMTEVFSASWVEERLVRHPFASVGALVPDAFESYARVLHPAYVHAEEQREETVTWETVASWTGRVAHPLMQFARIADLGDDPNAQPGWGRAPEAGDLPEEVAEPMVRVLEEFTTTADHCWLCLWEGFGGLDLIPGFDQLARVKGPGRQYLLFRDRIHTMVAWKDDPEHAWPENPQLWWPDDCAWCVATDIDLNSTYIGGSNECIARLLAEPNLEVVPARIDERVDVGADVVNLNQ